MNRVIRCLSILAALAVIMGPLQAQQRPEKLPNVDAKAFRHADLDIAAHLEEVRELPGPAASQARERLTRLGANFASARVDKRGGRFATLLPEGTVLVPGKANGLVWGDLGLKSAAPGRAVREKAAANALMAYLEANQADLGIDLAELSADYRMASHGNGDLYQFYLPREIGGIPVRGSFISATIGQGNLTLLSLNDWGDVPPANGRRLTAEQAMDAAVAYLSPLGVEREWGKPELAYVPLANGHGRNEYARGNGYRYQLVWSLKVEVTGDQGQWELFVDQKGNVLKNEDMNVYAEAKGGVYPKTNDGVVPDGNEHAGWPMPFAEVGSAITDTGGNYNLTGSQTARLYGPYVNMADNCGTESLTQSGGIDWGTSGGDDCTTPGFGGAGNTHASRSGFYELNRMKEMARSQLPSNSWLQARLTANMNINNTCNAYWNGSTVNFYRSGGGCSNTGEIAAVFDHEWGHGMDQNDVAGGIASPSGEGIADIYSSLRLNDSCIGRNFLSTNCGGYGDACTNCTGVRDIDYLAHQSGQPHDYSWSNSNCGGEVHCTGYVYAEAVWSLAKRTLQSVYGMDDNTAAEITTRLTYIAAGNTTTWYSGGPPNGGCSGSSGYMNYLAADDDDGNLNNGTPHMTAIYQAFNDQEIACGTPTVQDSGCSGTPSAAPNVTATPGNNQVALSWGAVSGASSYEVFRAEGIFACDFGKVKIGSTTGTSFTDTGLQNGRDYSYVVIPKGSNAACFGSASACDTVQPIAGPECTVDADCDDGLFCNGSETCNAGACVAGSDPCPGQGCDETGDVCTDTNGPQTAVYDAGLGAPVCSVAGSSCDSTTLLDSRDSLSPGEPNQPNTLDTCTDGTSGSYHSDESNDRIVVSTLDGQDFAEGATVEISATIWAWTTPSSDHLDLYYAADANNPTWVFITTLTPSSAGSNTLTAQYTLPSGGLQAVRANFRYNGSASSCSTGSYDDTDDLVFAVNTPVQCTVDADCDDGLFCNGAETCNAGTCEAGTAPNCNDGVACTDDACNEGTDSCDNVANDANCDNGLFCDGAETCNATLGCQAGTAPNCNDGVGCTDDSCNEGTDSCDNTPNDANCDDGQFCNGAETCSATLDCQAGTDPCGVFGCDEVGDVCLECNVDADCDDGLFCNGAETCNAGSCQAGSDPCPGQGCDEGGDVCTGQNGPQDAVYDSGLGAPACAVAGSECDSLALLDGRGTVGPEPNQPNTVDSCTDGSSGTYHSDESNDKIVVSTLDGADFVEGATVQVDATVYAWSTGTSDHLDLYYAADANNPVWQLITTINLSTGGLQTLSAQYTLPSGTLQAVRAHFRYNGSQSSCSTGSYDDADDLVFAVNPGGGGGGGCTVDDDFEAGAPAWTNDPASTCTTGDYVTGNPTNPSGGYQIVGSHSGTTSIFTATNSSAGVDDVDGGNCILGSPTWSVANASTLSVWYWFGQRDAGDDPSGDFNRLEYSVDNGVTWTTLASNGDSTSNPAWTNATASIPAGSNVQLRVQCSDGPATGDLVECGIDDVSICE